MNWRLFLQILSFFNAWILVISVSQRGGQDFIVTNTKQIPNLNPNEKAALGQILSSLGGKDVEITIVEQKTQPQQTVFQPPRNVYQQEQYGYPTQGRPFVGNSNTRIDVIEVYSKQPAYGNAYQVTGPTKYVPSSNNGGFIVVQQPGNSIPPPRYPGPPPRFSGPPPRFSGPPPRFPDPPSRNEGFPITQPDNGALPDLPSNIAESPVQQPSNSIPPPKYPGPPPRFSGPPARFPDSASGNEGFSIVPPGNAESPAQQPSDSVPPSRFPGSTPTFSGPPARSPDPAFPGPPARSPDPTFSGPPTRSPDPTSGKEGLSVPPKLDNTEHDHKNHHHSNAHKHHSHGNKNHSRKPSPPRQNPNDEKEDEENLKSKNEKKHMGNPDFVYPEPIDYDSSSDQDSINQSKSTKRNTDEKKKISEEEIEDHNVAGYINDFPVIFLDKDEIRK